MLAIMGWVSLTLLGGAPTPDGPGDLVRVEVRVMEMKGLAWRGEAFHTLTPLKPQGAASVWIASGAGLKILGEQADQVVRLPLAATAEHAASQIKNETHHNYVGQLKRIADGPPGESTVVAYQPVIATITDGVVAEISCRAVAGGTMVKATVDDRNLLGFHTVNVADSVTDPRTKKKTPVLNVHVQVPELTTCHVAGEWLVPRGDVLVVGFGAKSDRRSHSGVGERVVVIEPESLKTRDVELEELVIGGVKIPLEGFEPGPFKSADDRVRVAGYSRPKPMPPKVVVDPRPMPISPTVLPLLASPTLAPRAEWKATVRLEARVTPPAPSDQDVLTVMCLPLSPTPFPIRLANVWLGASIEPRRNDPARMPMAAPPMRGLPTPISVDGKVVELPRLPDDSVHLAGLTATGEPLPTPQCFMATVTPRPLRTLDAGVERILDQFFANRYATPNQFACDEVVIYPASTTGMAQVFDPSPQAPFQGGCFGTALPLAAERLAAARARLQRLEDSPPAPPVVVIRDLPPGATMAEGTKTDANFLRTYYANLFRSADGTAKVVEGHPIPIELPAVPKRDVRGATLGLQLVAADGECEYNSGISLKAIRTQPVTVRIPMADGTVVELQARVVNSAKR